jgi:hypothetical protein
MLTIVLIVALIMILVGALVVYSSNKRKNQSGVAATRVARGPSVGRADGPGDN